MNPSRVQFLKKASNVKSHQIYKGYLNDAIVRDIPRRFDNLAVLKENHNVLIHNKYIYNRGHDHSITLKVPTGISTYNFIKELRLFLKKEFPSFATPSMKIFSTTIKGGRILNILPSRVADTTGLIKLISSNVFRKFLNNRLYKPSKLFPDYCPSFSSTILHVIDNTVRVQVTINGEKATYIKLQEVIDLISICGPVVSIQPTGTDKHQQIYTTHVRDDGIFSDLPRRLMSLNNSIINNCTVKLTVMEGR